MKQFIGDAVMAEPLVSGLVNALGSVDIAAGPSVQEVLGASSSLVFHELVRVHSPWRIFEQARDLRRMSFDSALLVNNSFRSALTARLAGIPKRIGFPTEGRASLLTHVVISENDEFKAFANLRLARPLGIDIDRRVPKLSLRAEVAEPNLRAIPSGSVAIQPGARFSAKQVPLSCLNSLIMALAEAGIPVVLVGGAAERGIADKLLAMIKMPVTDLVGKTSIGQLMLVLKNVRLAVGADTGVQHLAAGLGCPTVTVFGPTYRKPWVHDYPPHCPITAPDRDMSLLGAEQLVSSCLEVLGSC